MGMMWGVLGAGFIANRAMIPAIQNCAGASVVGLASSSEQRGRETAARYAIERVYTDYQALLDDPDVQCVYIALPNYLHREWTIRAAQAGKHVLCEKPLAMNAAECDDMISACQQAHVLLMEAVMYRFHPRMQHVKRMLDAGEVGELRFLHCAFSFPFHAPANYRAFPEFGGGALLDIGSYCVNAARWLSGCEPRVHASRISYSREALDTAASAILECSDRLSAHIQCSFDAGEHQVIEVVGTSGAMNTPLAFTAWREDTTFLLVQRGQTFEQIQFAPADPYQLMVEHFMACARGETALRYPPQDGQATLRVLDALRNTRL